MKQIRFARTGYILISVLFYLSGIICIVLPEIKGKAPAIAGGLILIVYGIIKITSYLSKDLYCLAFQYDFACGLLLIVLGTVVLLIGQGFQGHLLSGLVGWAKEEDLRKKYDCNIPWAILLDPTSACNLHCTGCWAAEYGNKLNLSYEEIDDIICQGKELGVYLYIYTGGEPLVRRKDLIRLCEKHTDCVFLCFTNATLIDEAFADEMLRGR